MHTRCIVWKVIWGRSSDTIEYVIAATMEKAIALTLEIIASKEPVWAKRGNISTMDIKAIQRTDLDPAIEVSL